jgi:epoxyqueuosine reductase
MDCPFPGPPAGTGPAALSRKIKDRATALGFDLVGISPVGEPAHGQAFAEWLRRGYHGEMAYLARTQDQRSRPAAFLPWARSVVSVGLNYNTAHARQETQGLRGWISRYAWGADYRKVMQERLDALLEEIRQEAGIVQGRACVDAEPVLDRESAVRAGIGWVGKNTNLLAMGLGSFFFLGELFLNLDLEYDRPVRDRCGRCRLCLDACPTRAFVGPYLLDARKCISYLTIELKGAMPRELRPLVGAHIFGCDICQDVCPYNTRGSWTREAAFQPRGGLHAPELIPLLSLTEQEFKARFAGGPIRRAKRRGLLRNVCVALGNLHRAEAVPALVRSLLGDREALVRTHAAWALGQIGTPEAVTDLRQALEGEADPDAREEIGAALAETGRRGTDRQGNGR